MKVRAAITSAAVALIAAACASTTGTTGTTATGTRAAERAPRLDTRVAPFLTPELLREKVAPERSTLRALGADVLVPDANRTMLDLVQRHWPSLLRPPRNVAAPGPDLRDDIVGVYSGNTFIGGQAVLANIPARQVLAAYRLTRTEESARWGRIHPGGAVEIIWRTPSTVPR